MRHTFSLLLASTLLVACTTENTNSRYKDTSELEQPPTLPSDPSYRPDNSYGMDEGRIDKRRAGLGSNVYLVEGSPLQLRIKQPTEKAWYIVARALKDGEFKITDFDKAKKQFYIGYGESSDGLFGLFATEPDQYVLAMKEYGKETVIIATLLENNSGKAGDNKDGYQEGSAGTNSDQVLRKLYDVLHNDVEQ